MTALFDDNVCTGFSGGSAASTTACLNTGIAFGISFQIQSVGGVLSASQWNSNLACSGTPSFTVSGKLENGISVILG